MANKLQLKRSSVPGKVPTTADLDLGEIAINTYDGKAYMKKNVSGVESIVLLVGAGSGDVVGPAASTDNAFARFDGVTGKLIQNSTNATLDDNGNASFNSLALTTNLAIAYGGTGAGTNTDARLNLNVPSRSGLSTANGGDASIFAIDKRAAPNPTADLGYIYGARFRFGANNESSASPNFYCDTIDFSTFVDSSGGGFNSLMFRKDTNQVWHKYAGAGATTWTTNKQLAYRDPGSSWQNVTASRAADSTYTNTSGGVRLVLITARANGGAGSGSGNVTVSGSTITTFALAESNGSSWNQLVNTFFVAVPNGATYALTLNSSAFTTWFELDL